ncbi:MAG: hypothetical protein ACFB03_19160 [Paracoccaceae bacterium]
MPLTPAALAESTPLTDLDEVDAEAWLKRPAGWELHAQTLHQQDDHATTWLLAEKTGGPLLALPMASQANWGNRRSADGPANADPAPIFSFTV